MELQRDNVITYGFIRFIGEMKGQRGIWYGVELDEPRGRHNGCYANREYFRCEKGPNHGLFVRKAFIKRTLIPKSNENRPRLSIGDSVYVWNKKCQGVIRYMGYAVPFIVNLRF